jgi:hypothetical protein
VVGDFTCAFYMAVIEPVYDARVDMIRKYGESQGIRSMIKDISQEE